MDLETNAVSAIWQLVVDFVVGYVVVVAILQLRSPRLPANQCYESRFESVAFIPVPVGAKGISTTIITNCTGF